MNSELFRYIDGQMSDFEKESFEKKLGGSSELRAEYELVAGKIHVIKDYQKISENDSAYFNNILPKFRSRLETAQKPKLFFVPKYSVAVPAMLLMFIVSSVFVNKNVERKMLNNKPVYVFSEQEKNEIINEYASDIDINENVTAKIDEQRGDSIEKKFVEGLNVDDDELFNAISPATDDYSKLIDNLTEKEADRIYNEIINKNI